jgi:hypothetical protein
MNILIIKDGYVIASAYFEQEPPEDWTYPFPHDYIVHDLHENAGIGDWHEKEEGVFYRPLSAPPDLPSELTNP